MSKINSSSPKRQESVPPLVEKSLFPKNERQIKIDQSRERHLLPRQNSQGVEIAGLRTQILTENLGDQPEGFKKEAELTRTTSSFFLYPPSDVLEIRAYLRTKGFTDDEFDVLNINQRIDFSRSLLDYIANQGMPALDAQFNSLESLFKNKEALLIFEIVQKNFAIDSSLTAFDTLSPSQKKKVQYYIDQGEGLTLLLNATHSKLFEKAPNNFFKIFDRDLSLRNRLNQIARKTPPPTFQQLVSAETPQLSSKEKKQLKALMKKIPLTTLNPYIIQSDGKIDIPHLRVCLVAGKSLNRTFKFKDSYFPKTDGDFARPSVMVTKKGEVFVTLYHIKKGTSKHVKSAYHLNKNQEVMRATIKNKNDAIKDAKQEYKYFKIIAKSGNPHIYTPFQEMVEVNGKLIVIGDIYKADGTVIAEAPLKQKVVAFHQMATGLALMHNNGIVHNDFKPGNTLISEVESEALHLVIIDLGGAKKIGEMQEIYTPAYLAPEGKTHSDPVRDSWALGVTYMVLLGGKDAAAVLKTYERFSTKAISLNEAWLAEINAVKKSKVSSAEKNASYNEIHEKYRIEHFENAENAFSAAQALIRPNYVGKEKKIVDTILANVCKPLLNYLPPERMSANEAKIKLDGIMKL